MLLKKREIAKKWIVSEHWIDIENKNDKKKKSNNTDLERLQKE